MHAISRAADRMLNALVPKITADASCAIYQWKQECSCRGNYVYEQNCQTEYSCAVVCGSCYSSGIEC
jgi:hypothetical protein